MTSATCALGVATGLIAAVMLSAASAQSRDPGAPTQSRDPGAASSPIGADYRLEPGDKLRIDVYKDEQLSQSVQIRPDGKITMPLVGDIAAHGLTPIELRDRITTVLAEYVQKPVITVVVVEATAPTAYVVGEVNRPGAVVVQGNMTVLQALAVVGGLKDFADQRNIRILRKGPSGVQTVAFSYKEAMKGTAPPVYLMPGDTVVVPD